MSSWNIFVETPDFELRLPPAFTSETGQHNTILPSANENLPCCEAMFCFNDLHGGSKRVVLIDVYLADCFFERLPLLGTVSCFTNCFWGLV